jgi:hypothetical protein
MIITSCSTPSEKINADNKQLSENPVLSNNEKTKLEVLGVYDLEGGTLYVYKFENDTIYWAEGRSSSYPVGLQIK